MKTGTKIASVEEARSLEKDQRERIESAFQALQGMGITAYEDTDRVEMPLHILKGLFAPFEQVDPETIIEETTRRLLKMKTYNPVEAVVEAMNYLKRILLTSSLDILDQHQHHVRMIEEENRRR